MRAIKPTSVIDRHIYPASNSPGEFTGTVGDSLGDPQRFGPARVSYWVSQRSPSAYSLHFPHGRGSLCVPQVSPIGDHPGISHKSKR